jgi:hypothetical protein
MALYDQVPITPYNSVQAGVIPEEVYGVAMNWFINRTPLATRLPQMGCGSASFKVTNDQFRPRNVVTNGAYSTSGTSLPFADSTVFDVGDVLQVDSELFLITAIPNTTSVTVTFGYASTTNAAHSSGANAKVITNTRTGAEVNMASMSRVPQAVTQYLQTIHHTYSVGGAIQAATNYYGGAWTPLQRDVFLATQHVMDDQESAYYYGKALAQSAVGGRPMMGGLSNLVVTNRVTSPTNSSTYKPQDLIRDTITRCVSGGGNPNLIVASTDFIAGVATWGNQLVRLEAGANAYGNQIDLFYAPVVGPVNIIIAPLLDLGTIICLTADEVLQRVATPIYNKPRGSRGHAIEGDIIWEGAIELINESHHAYVTGITGYSAP